MRLLDKDPWGVETRFYYDQSADTYTIDRWQDCEKVLDHAHNLRSLNDGYSPSREWKRMGSIPLPDYEALCKQVGMNVSLLPSEEKAKLFRKYFAEKSKLKTAPETQPYRKPWAGSINAPTAGELVRRGNIDLR